METLEAHLNFSLFLKNPNNFAYYTRIPGKHIDRRVREGNGERRKKHTQCTMYICLLPFFVVLPFIIQLHTNKNPS